MISPLLFRPPNIESEPDVADESIASESEDGYVENEKIMEGSGDFEKAREADDDGDVVLTTRMSDHDGAYEIDKARPIWDGSADEDSDVDDGLEGGPASSDNLTKMPSR